LGLTSNSSGDVSRSSVSNSTGDVSRSGVPNSTGDVSRSGEPNSTGDVSLSGVPNSTGDVSRSGVPNSTGDVSRSGDIGLCIIFCGGLNFPASDLPPSKPASAPVLVPTPKAISFLGGEFVIIACRAIAISSWVFSFRTSPPCLLPWVFSSFSLPG